MAGFKGFGFTSSAELQEGLNQQFKRAQTSGDLDAARMGIAGQAANSLAPTEAVREANKKEAVLSDAFKSSQKTSTGDEVEDQINFLRNAQKAAIDAELPDIAMQATEQLSALRLGQEERSRLKAGEDREAAKFDAVMQEFEQDTLLKSQQVLVDESNDPVFNVDLTNKGDIEKFQAELKENPNYRLVSTSDLFEFNSDQLLQQQRLKDAANRADSLDTKIPKNTLNEFNRTAVQQMTFAHSLDNMVDLIGDNPDLFTVSASLMGGVSKLAAQGRGAMRALGMEGITDGRITSKLEDAGVAVGKRRANVMDMAYALATSREGGRLTDQDIDRAIETLGFLDNPDPRVVISVLQDRVSNARESWTSRGKVANVRTDVATKDSWEEVDRIYTRSAAKLDAALARLTSSEDEEVEEAVSADPAQNTLGISTQEAATLFN